MPRILIFNLIRNLGNLQIFFSKTFTSVIWSKTFFFVVEVEIYLLSLDTVIQGQKFGAHSDNQIHY